MYTKKFYFDAKNHLPFSDLRCDQYPLRREPKCAQNGDFSHVFACAATGIDRIANQRTGGDFSNRNRTFLNTSLSCVKNIQILNCARSFDGVSWRTAAQTAGEPWSTIPRMQDVSRCVGSAASLVSETLTTLLRCMMTALLCLRGVSHSLPLEARIAIASCVVTEMFS